jgi:hypothetical protein
VIQELITRLLDKRDMRQAIEGYGELVTEAATLREVNRVLMDALAFYADDESYEGDPVPVMEDRGRGARIVLKTAQEMVAAWQGRAK